MDLNQLMSLTVSGIHQSDINQIEVYDVVGKKVFELHSAVISASSKINIDVSKLREGIYVICILKNDKVS